MLCTKVAVGNNMCSQLTFPSIQLIPMKFSRVKTHLGEVNWLCVGKMHVGSNWRRSTVYASTNLWSRPTRQGLGHIKA